MSINREQAQKQKSMASSISPDSLVFTTKKEIEKCFTYHPPKEGQSERYAEMRAKIRVLADYIVDNTPSSREQGIALQYLENAMMWANAAIARNE